MIMTNDAGRSAAARNFVIGDTLIANTSVLPEPGIQAEQRLRQALVNAHIGTAKFSIDLLLVEVNPVFCELFGYRETELLLTGLAELMHPEDVVACRLACSALASGAQHTVSIEGRCLTATGQVVWMQMTLTGAEGTDMHPTRIIGQFQVAAGHAAQQVPAK